MKAWISFCRLNSIQETALLLLDINSGEVIKEISYDELIQDIPLHGNNSPPDGECGNAFRGVSGISWNKERFFFATYYAVYECDNDFKNTRIIYPYRNINQIDWLSTNEGNNFPSSDGLGICDANCVVKVTGNVNDIAVLHFSSDSNIVSLYKDNEHSYFVHHCQLEGGAIIRDDGVEMFSDLLSRPHNIYVNKEHLIICNSGYNSVIKKPLEGDECDEILLSHFTRGLALKENIMLVGESDSKRHRCRITILDFDDFLDIDEIHLEGEIYDIRITEGDLCMSN